MNKKLVALSIGSSSIAAAIGAFENGEFELKETISRPSKGVCKGKITDSNLAREAILEVLDELSRKNSARIDSVYIALGVENICIRQNRGAVLLESGNIIEKKALLDAYKDGKNIKINSDEYIIDAVIRNIYKDGKPVEQDFMGTNALSLEMDLDVIIAKHDDNILFKDIFESINCEINGFILSVESLRRMFIDDNGNRSLLIDFGLEKTEFMYYEDNTIKNMGKINLGGFNITKDLAIVTKSDIDTVEKLKIEYSSNYDELRRSFAKIDLEGDSIDADLFYEVINARIEEILLCIKKELESLGVYDKIENIAIFGDSIGSFENIDILIGEILGKKPKIFTKNEVNVEKSSIITPIAIVKQVYDRLKLLGEDEIVRVEEINIINSTSNETSDEENKKVKKKGLSKVLGFLGDIF